VSGPDESEQLELLHAPAPQRWRVRTPEPPAAEFPIARVLVEVPLAHLDRPFDYSVPAGMTDTAVPGARVSVPFAGSTHDGFIIERRADTDHTGRLSRLRRVISPEPALAPEIARLARAVADRYAGTAADVLRLAVPPRHARTEAAESPPPLPAPPEPAIGGWADYSTGPALLTALSGDGLPRAVWNPGPAADWPDLLARLVVANLAGGRGALVVAPDARTVARIDAALTAVAGPGRHVVLEAELGPAERYARWLALRRGSVRAVVGTRSAMFAPVAGLGLVVIWDDGDDLHAEPRAPYPHAREVLLLRAHEQGTAAVVGGFARTAEAEQLIVSGWARPLLPVRELVRSTVPRVRTVGDDRERRRDPAARTARIPTLAWRTARDGLADGPVLVQVPRAGYVPALACGRCRTPARCATCQGPLHVRAAGSAAACAWCGREASWRCPSCGGSAVRAIATGVRRTAEELGRAFPGTPVRLSRGDGVLPAVDAAPALIVATPGAEPVAAGGYAAALLLDGQALLARTDLRAAEEALRRWMTAAALVRPGPDGGRVVIIADPAAPAVQALVRWDPAGFAERELADRQQLRFPPAARVAELTGAPADVTTLLGLVELPRGADVLGPVPATEPDTERVLVRVPRASGAALAAALKAAQGVRAAKRSGGAVRVRIDPADLG
jgi:primosomal protein N' (replication factor Y) (superfamily II helicase)